MILDRGDGTWSWPERAASPVGSQMGIDWTPAARELAQAVRKRETKAEAILARLRVGRAGTAELARIGGVRFGARILELRQQGHRIVTEGHADHAIYSLEGE